MIVGHLVEVGYNCVYVAAVYFNFFVGQHDFDVAAVVVVAAGAGGGVGSGIFLLGRGSSGGCAGRRRIGGRKRAAIRDGGRVGTGVSVGHT